MNCSVENNRRLQFSITWASIRIQLTCKDKQYFKKVECKMGVSLNIDYIRSSRGLILTAEFAVGLIGGIIAAVYADHFLSFCLWSTILISGIMLALNVLKAYRTLHDKFSFLIFVELGYIAMWVLFYVVAANIWLSVLSGKGYLKDAIIG